MKKLFSVMALLVALILPCLAQAQIRLSLSDQKRFDSYYSRWQSYKATNNQKEVRSMEGRMQDVYRHYGIPAGTPYGRVASSGQGSWVGSPDRNTIGTETVIGIETAIGTATGIVIELTTGMDIMTTGDIAGGTSTITTATRTMTEITTMTNDR